MSIAVRFAVGATATALVTVTVLAPISEEHGLALSSTQLDMLGKNHEEITIINYGSSWREIRIDLESQSGGAVCNLHFSPMTSTIPPGGMQVLRVMARADSGEPCTTDHRLIITDPTSPAPLFEVPVRTAQG